MLLFVVQVNDVAIAAKLGRAYCTCAVVGELFAAIVVCDRVAGAWIVKRM